MEKPKCANDCSWPEADLWAAIMHKGRFYCAPCAQKLGLIKANADGEIEFCHPYSEPEKNLGTLH